MFYILGIVAGVIVLALIVLLLVAAMQPAAFKIERSAVVAAPPEKVYGLIEDFHQWSKWSPWERLDPSLQRTYSGAEKGTGAKYSWVGNKKVGEGRMTILDCQPPQKVVIKLEFLKPFAATNQAMFMLVPEGAGTRVTWSMTGNRPFMMKAFSLVMNMDKLVGGDFEKGLANMDAAVRQG